MHVILAILVKSWVDWVDVEMRCEELNVVYVVNHFSSKECQKMSHCFWERNLKSCLWQQ